jgi:hypothetical protein
MSLWSKIKKFFGVEREPPRRVSPTPPVESGLPKPPPQPPEKKSPQDLLYQKFIVVPGEYERIKRRTDLVWEVWKERRINILEGWIVNQGKALKGHPAADFGDIVRWGIELEYLRPKINWRKDLNTP